MTGLLKFSRNRDGKIVLVDPDAIMYVVGDDRGCQLTLKNNEVIGIIESVNVVENFLNNFLTSKKKTV